MRGFEIWQQKIQSSNPALNELKRVLASLKQLDPVII
jgi:hypothetical protein